jgi:hypothetical protein
MSEPVSTEEWIAQWVGVLAAWKSGVLTPEEAQAQLTAVTNAWSGLLYSDAGIAHTQAKLIAELGPLQTRQIIAFTTGKPDGGPNGDGRYPIAIDGREVLVPCPRAIDATADKLVQAAQGWARKVITATAYTVTAADMGSSLIQRSGSDSTWTLPDPAGLALDAMLQWEVAPDTPGMISLRDHLGGTGLLRNEAGVFRSARPGSQGAARVIDLLSGAHAWKITGGVA